MSTLSLPARSLALGPWIRAVAVAVGVGAVAMVSGALVAAQSPLVHPLLAALLGGTLVLVGLRSPRLAVVATLLYLPFLAFGRRLLILYDGWHSQEPLLLVAPTVAAALVLHHRSRLGGGRLSSLVVAFLALAGLSSVNPLGGSLRSGVVGLLFVAAPMLWFFVGRELVDKRLVAIVLSGAVAAAALIAVYGLSQTLNGFTPWDAAWLGKGGFASLQVGDVIRPFGTFSSPAEYATYLGAAIAVCVAFALHGRPYVLALVPLLGLALFLESSRGILVSATVGVIALVGLRTRRIVAAAVVIATVLLVIGFAWKSYGQSAISRGEQSGNALVEHQIGGLAHPLDREQSTLLAHWELVTNGFKGVLDRPLGLGTGATNLAGSRYGGVSAGTEVDVSNAFVALGILGGAIYVAIIATTLRRAFGLYRAHGDVVVFAVVGVLLVSLGQWLNGGYYALAPLVWLLIGWVERESAQLGPRGRTIGD